MNIKININRGGGIFSKFMLAVQSIISQVDINNVDNIYFSLIIDNINIFNYVLEQNIKLKYNKHLTTIRCVVYQDLFNHVDISKLRTLKNKLIIKESILNKINKNIDNNTIGVHIRLTDMNVNHANDYGIFHFSDFERKLENVIKKEGKSKIFVASDNNESIIKLNKNFDIMHYNLSNRNNCEIDNNSSYNTILKKNIYSKLFWEDSFLEMISLSRCGFLINRVSNLNNASILFSNDNLKKVYKL